MNNFFVKSKEFLLIFLVVIFPFFFLPFTQEYFLTNKLYLVTFIGLIIFTINALQIFFSKKISLSFKALDLPIGLFLLAIFMSLMFNSFNKVEGLMTVNFGFVAFLSLTIVYFYLSRLHKLPEILKFIPAMSAVLSFITVVFFFNPFAKTAFPFEWLSLKNPSFTPLGSQLDLAIFLGFFLIYNIFNVIATIKESKKKPSNPVFDYAITALNLLALFLSIYRLNMAPQPSTNQAPFILPPWNLSWLAAVEVLKNIKTALFGIGIGNFSIVFTRVKDISYNQSFLWQINSFNSASSTLLHIFAESGLFGIAAFVFICVSAVQKLFFSLKQPHDHVDFSLFFYLFAYLFICLFFFPPSFSVFFLFFVILAFISERDQSDIDITPTVSAPIFFIVFSVLFMAAVIFSGYLLGRSYLAEYYFQQSIKGISSNNARSTYDNMRQARSLNPYEERYILNFSQVNLLIAQNIANKPAAKITTADRQTIAQAIQASISESKELIRLNPQKAQYWENLALIYKNIISIAKDADGWSVSSYQRAIVLDPTNPNYTLNLGGVYYVLGQYDQATKLFQQSLVDKPNWPNAYYNLAWSYFESKQYDNAINAMQGTLSLINKNISPGDWNKANGDLDNFKNQLTQQESTKSGSLKLPEKPSANINPKLELTK